MSARRRVSDSRPFVAVAAALISMLWLFASPAPSSAQLLSPGKLTEVHADLEGPRQSTQCHEARRRGVQESLCLQCHEPLRERLTEGRGFHATLSGTACGTCHKEHGGRDADMLRFDEDSFEHEREAGFALTGAHGSAECAQCHNRGLVTDRAVRRFKAQGRALDKTFMGLGTTCVACHQPEDPHRTQFEDRGCEQCHNEVEWEDPGGFDHDEARFRLEGEHASVRCVSCHAQEAPAVDGIAALIRYRPLPFGACESCHVDNHDGQMGTCTECHTPAGWSQIPRDKFESSFDHNQTDFELEGVHIELACVSCHQESGLAESIQMQYAAENRTPSYPQPVVETGCMSCHVDYHLGDVSAIEAGDDCTACHSVDGWLPSSFDLFRHNSDTPFELAGAHAAVPCASCHEPNDRTNVTLQVDGPRVAFHIDASQCSSCHTSDSPHGDQFKGRTCESCHTNNEVFRIASFDHEQTSFPLTGSHENVDCVSCHPTEPTAGGVERVVYRPLQVECAACHSEVQ